MLEASFSFRLHGNHLRDESPHEKFPLASLYAPEQRGMNYASASIESAKENAFQLEKSIFLAQTFTFVPLPTLWNSIVWEPNGYLPRTESFNPFAFGLMKIWNLFRVAPFTIAGK